MPYAFTTPTIQVGFSGQAPHAGYRLFRRMRLATGQTLLKNGSFYTLLSEPDSDVFDAADVAYLGGHTYTVSDLEAADLTAAGYGGTLTFLTPDDGGPVDPGGGGGGGGGPTDPAEYGLGAYGVGIYGQ